MAHAPATVLELASSGANLHVTAGHAPDTYVEVARIVASLGTHATLDLSRSAPDTVQRASAAGGKHVTIIV